MKNLENLHRINTIIKFMAIMPNVVCFLPDEIKDAFVDASVKTLKDIEDLYKSLKEELKEYVEPTDGSGE